MTTPRAEVTSLLLGLCGAAGLWSCGSKAEQDTPTPSSSEALQNEAAHGTKVLSDEALKATWEELGVPGAGNRPDLAGTPTGYLALSRRSIGDTRAPSAWESHLYRSTDGIRWGRLEVSEENDNLWLRGVAYGAGHYVLAGMRFDGGDGVIFHSTDADTWEEISVATGAPSGLSDVVFSGNRFFALSTFRTMLTSIDGTTWTSVDLGTTAMPLDVTLGNGVYMVVGSGDVQRSIDGLQWLPLQLDCRMPGACIMAPDGQPGQGLHSRAVFAGGAFFIDQAMLDGESWVSMPGLYPQTAMNDYVLGSSAMAELASWTRERTAHALTSVRYIDTLASSDRPTRMRWNGAVDPDEFNPVNFPNDSPLPEQIDFPFTGESDCTTAACVIVGERLYLVSTTL